MSTSIIIIIYWAIMNLLIYEVWFRVMVFNATFNNISAISWQSVLLVEEKGWLIDFWCLTPLSAIFQLYHQFQWWKKPEYLERTTDNGQATGKLYHLWLRVECTLFCNLGVPGVKPPTWWKSLTNFITKCYIAWVGFELTTLVVIDTDYIGSCNPIPC